MFLRSSAAALLIMAACGLLTGGVAWGQGRPRVAVFLSEYGRPHMGVLEALRGELGREVDLVLGNDQEPVPPNSVLAIAVGMRACDILAKSSVNVPVLCSLVPRAGFESIVATARGRDRQKLSALFLDVPPRRQMAFLRQILPGRRRVALLTGNGSAVEAAQFGLAARELGMNVTAVAVIQESDIYPALLRLLPEADALLALPDPSVYNSRTLQDILLTAYRHKVPLVGFSSAYAKAGALYALYATPNQIGRQTAEMTRTVLAGRGLPAPLYPRNIDLSFNAYVAQSLDIGLKDEIALKERLRQLEHQP